MSLTVTISSLPKTLLMGIWKSAATGAKVCLIPGQASYTFHQYRYVKKGKTYLMLTTDIDANETAAILATT